MTAAAGAAFAGLTALEAREAVVAALREAGAVSRTESYTHAVPFCHRSGERIEPLIIAAVVHATWRRWPRPRSRAVEDGSLRIHPESQRKRYLDWLADDPPLVHLAPAVVGPSDPGLVPRGRGDRFTSGWGRRRATAGSATRTCSTPGSRRRLWPFATLGWPDATPELRAFYPTDVLSTGRDILFLWVARMVMMGIEFTGEVPFADVYIHSIDPGPGRAPDDQVARHRHRPARRDRRARRGRRRASACWRCPRRRTCASPRRRSPRAASSRTSCSTRRGSCSCAPTRTSCSTPRRRCPRRSRTPGSSRGSSAPRRTRRARSRRSSSTASRSASTTSSTASSATGTWRSSSRGSTRRTTRRSPLRARTCWRETLAIAHPVIPFVTEEMWSHVPGGDGLLRRAPGRRADPALVDAEAEARDRARDRRRPGAARLARRDRRVARRGAAGAARRRRLRADRRVRRASRPLHVGRRRRRRPVAAVAVPGGTVAMLRLGRRRPRRRGAPDRGAPRVARRRDRARREQARQRGVRGQGAGRTWSPRSATSSRGSQEELGDRSWTWHALPERRGAPARRSSCSGCSFGLERMRRLLTALGLARRSASTRSTWSARTARARPSRMTAALLEAHGVRAGAFLSPHLTTFAERIRIGDADLDAAAFGAAVERAAAAAAKVDRALEEGDRVTQFELLTAAAFDALARGGVEVAVVEAGLGGRYDATERPARPGRRAHQRRPRAHALARPDDRRHRAREARGRRARRDAGARRRPSPRSSALAEATGARDRARRSRLESDCSPGVPARQLRAGLRRGRARCSGSSTRRSSRTSPRGSPCPGGCRSSPSGRSRSSTARTTRAGSRPLAAALPERPFVGVVSILDDKDAAAMLRVLAPTCERFVCTAAPQPARAAAGDARLARRAARARSRRSVPAPRARARACT